MVHRHEVVASTQDLAHELAERGAPQGTTVVAARQTGGRGTRGRRWDSPAGGLWLSVVIRPQPVASDVLSLRIGLGLAGTLERLVGHPIQLKWPNDLMAAGGKLGGILCEARWSGARLGWITAGIGLNVTNPIPPGLPAVRLADLGFGGGLEKLLPLVTGAVLGAGEAVGPLSDAERADFRARDWLFGRALVAPVPGTAAGITAAGRLVIGRSDGSWVETTETVTLAPLAPGAPTR